MVKISNKILSDIHSFIDELNKNQIEITDAYLFGSYSNNKANEYSDIDLALISEDFTGDRFEDKDMMRDIYLKINWKISPYPIKKSQLNDNWFFQSEISNKGIKVF